MIRYFIKRIIKFFFPRFIFNCSAKNFIVGSNNSFLHKTGWMRSLKEGKPVDEDGYSLPWLNYSVIELFRNLGKNDFHLFEWGSGHGTLFFARLFKTVTSVEHDSTWLQYVKHRAPENVELILKRSDTDGEYCRAIKNTGLRYDCIIIDGQDRYNCIIQALQTLSDVGVVVVDDTNRDKLPQLDSLTIPQGFRRLTLSNMKPLRNSRYTATILYREKNIFGI